MTDALETAKTASRGVASPHLRGLRVESISKTYATDLGPRTVLNQVSFAMASHERLAILGRNGAGKSTLVKMLGGVERPSAGRIVKTCALSWPLAFSGGFEPALTGLDNIRFIARLYGQDAADVLEQVDTFAELGRHLRLPVELYSTGMRMRLAFGLTLAIPFDCVLVDEVIAVGDPRFQRKCHRALFEDTPSRGLILVTHDLGLAAQACQRALILKQGFGAVVSDMALATSICMTL